MKHLGTTASGQDIATQSQLGGGGGAALEQRTLSVPIVASTGYAEVVVPFPGSSSADMVSASFGLDSGGENDLEELIDTDMRIWSIPESNQIRFVLTGNAAFVGTYSINFLRTVGFAP